MSQDHTEPDIELERLAAIVESSDDAIISKTLDGVIRTWNKGAEKIFGYAAEEMIGQPIIKVIPKDLQSEETEILARLRRGERIDHFDTIRLAKDGRRIAISLTVSPLRDKTGKVVGASKIARDVTERKRAEELQTLLVDELNHRVKNMLAIIQSVANQSLAFSAAPQDFFSSFTGRLEALSHAHDLLVREKMRGISINALLSTQLGADTHAGKQITISGPDLLIGGSLAVHLALIFHELATNARKYGSLSDPAGKLRVSWQELSGDVPSIELVWKESGLAGLEAPVDKGFGSALIEKSLSGFGGDADIRLEDDGLRVVIRFPLQKASHLPEELMPPQPSPTETTAPEPCDLTGVRILVVEDEVIVAMDLEMKLEQLGLECTGTAATVAEALEAIEARPPEIALLDANLRGERVDLIAEALAARNIPFAFASGYARDTLPEAFRDRELLAKPYGDRRLFSVLTKIAGERKEIAEAAGHRD